MENRKANLFIVGAMKAGTTSFVNALALHPAIYFSPVKEPNFFVDHLPNSIYNPGKYFSVNDYFKNKFPQPLHIAHIKERHQYDLLFSQASTNCRYLAEGSTAYLHDAESAEKIFNYNKNAKIIILVRNGLRRALSHYKMDKGLGRITKPFNTLLNENLIDYKKKSLSNWSYLGMSLYAENIFRYKKYFKDNVLVISFEDLIKHDGPIFKNVFAFLNLDYYPVKLEKANESSNIRFSSALNFFYKSGIKDLFSKLMPVKVRHAVFNLFKKNIPLTIEVSTELKVELLNLFQQDMHKIELLC